VSTSESGASDLFAIDPLGAAGLRRPSFVSGDPAGDRLRVRYFRRRSDDALVVEAWFGPGAEGPPGHAHGGSIAAVLDEAMGVAVWLAGHKAVAAELVTSFRRLVPLDTTAGVETTIARVAGRKVTVRARLHDATGETFADAEGLFVLLGPETMATLERMR